MYYSFTSAIPYKLTTHSMNNVSTIPLFIIRIRIKDDDPYLHVYIYTVKLIQDKIRSS